ncbi:MAG: aconitate hydratase AcnA [Gammaproteobacteria bacterium]|nr:aconitate hydratase AcnA [Gammaproteobacteria bacterium]NIR32844.1 aconitate hydratase AcnA [Gammaproteobacteria bacterium]NIR99391.1 aconitate hydratase AcnA [Gammaproteobacteria bacterium]NIT65005.1 aconitate hydratase AcnA [Gammaproteobacteria bacterium]NIV21919.1 aconitate hydratase AcnA [Gammaproteobacteria bacterium]
MSDSFNARDVLAVNGKRYEIFRLGAVPNAARLPFSLKILLENLLRCEDGVTVRADDIRALADWDPKAEPSREIAFRPARVLMQDFTGVPAVVDLAAMRDAVKRLGGDPERINPLQPAELVIDHSVQVDNYASADAMDINGLLEYRRNAERYSFLKWGQQAFTNFRVVPPDTGIVHQVNLEYLARVVFAKPGAGMPQAYPDTLVGTDSHTTMINGLGVLGWGVGGIEAEAAMLGQPVTMLIPQVVGFRLCGRLPEGATATDLVLTVVEMLRKHGVVGKFVEFFGDGLTHLPLADRATIANMAPEYGATCGIFPVDQETLEYLRLTGRGDEQEALVETYAREQGLFRTDGMPQADYSDMLELDLGAVTPSLAGPRRPQDRVPLYAARPMIRGALRELMHERGLIEEEDKETERFEGEGGHTAVGVERQGVHRGHVRVHHAGEEFYLDDGMVVIAAITSCTNTSNPSVMLGAGLVAKKAAERGLKVKPWVKTSLAPGSKVVTDYLQRAGLTGHLEALGFHVVGYGCTTCIGNSGPLPQPISDAIKADDLVVCSVLSGNRNFEGRIHPEVHMNYLASPPLVVAYAIAGRMDIDIVNEPLGTDDSGAEVYLKDIWPSQQEIQQAVLSSVVPEGFKKAYADVFRGSQRWVELAAPAGQLFEWSDASTYVKNPPYFEGMSREPETVADIDGARVLALLGDSVTTDHISPAGAIGADTPAGRYLTEHGVKTGEFNSYGSRRGNHEVMMRGTFANIRLRNLLAPGTEGGVTRHQPGGELMTIYEAAMRYRDQNVPLLVIAGKEYGSGSSRDWAAKGPRLLGVRAVIAESYERIHRSNLVGMGVLPLQFKDGQGARALGLDGTETYNIEGLDEGRAREVTVIATAADGTRKEFRARVRIDTPQEVEYYRHGGILHYVLRQLAG